MPISKLTRYRRPALLAMYALVPLVTFLLVSGLTLEPAVRVAMLVLAVSAGAPLLPRKLVRLGNRAYVVSLVLMSSLLLARLNAAGRA